MLRRAWIACLLLACSSAEEQPSELAPQPTSGSETIESAPTSQMAVTGIMGTIPEHKVQATLEPLLPKFARCFAQGAQDIEFIGGHMRFYFRVALDGSVQWVYPRESSVGHRGAERCLLDLAQRVRFPQPKGGGEAEVAWGFDIEPSDGVRPPVEWGADRVASLRRELAADCSLSDARVSVTAYVSPGGKVAAAGAAADSQRGAAQIDCVLSAVQAARFPDPGSYAAKVSFELP